LAQLPTAGFGGACEFTQF
ncbi:unnamed protein product, partial [Rotaria socialis]